MVPVSVCFLLLNLTLTGTRRTGKELFFLRVFELWQSAEDAALQV